MADVADVAELRAEVPAVGAAQVADGQPGAVRVPRVEGPRDPQHDPDQAIGAPAAPGTVGRAAQDGIPGDEGAALRREAHAGFEAPAGRDADGRRVVPGDVGPWRLRLRPVAGV